jgi:hypothetical protein
MIYVREHTCPVPTMSDMMIDHVGSIHNLILTLKSPREICVVFPEEKEEKCIKTHKDIDMFFPSQEGTAIWVLFVDGTEDYFLAETCEPIRSRRNLPAITFMR